MMQDMTGEKGDACSFAPRIAGELGKDFAGGVIA